MKPKLYFTHRMICTAWPYAYNKFHSPSTALASKPSYLPAFLWTNSFPCDNIIMIWKNFNSLVYRVHSHMQYAMYIPPRTVAPQREIHCTTACTHFFLFGQFLVSFYPKLIASLHFRLSGASGQVVQWETSFHQVLTIAVAFVVAGMEANYTDLDKPSYPLMAAITGEAQ